MSIGGNIKRIRKEKGLTQKELADKCNLSRSYLADVERDRYNPSLDTLTVIAKNLDVKVSTLLGEGDCKYCKNPSAFLAICQNYETRIFISVSGSYLQIFDEDYPGFCDNHKINFCPMCGRKLS